MKFVRVSVVFALFLLALSSISAQDAQTPQEICDAAEPAELTEMQFDAPENVLEAGVDYRAVFCTGAGAVYVDLYEDLTPITVNSFVFLAQQGYYDNTTFHRVIEDFMAQAGDPTASGSGGPGYQFQDEPVGYLTFDRPGLLAMANAGAGTNGSQFFITTAPTDWLNYQHTIFGDVLEGYENVQNIELRDPATAEEPGEALSTVVIIEDASTVVTTYENPEPATSDELVAAFEVFTDQLPDTFPLDTEVSGLIATEDAVASVAEEFQGAFADFADAYGHQYRYTSRILNGECDTNQFFSYLQYTIDTFESGDAARAALSDDFITTLADANGFEAVEGFDNTYIVATPTCSEGDGVHAMRMYTRGRYLITVEALLDQVMIDGFGVGVDVILDEGVASPFEVGLGAVFIPELRS